MLQQSILGTRPSVTAQVNIPTKLTHSAVISILTRLSLFEGKGEDWLFEHWQCSKIIRWMDTWMSKWMSEGMYLESYY